MHNYKMKQMLELCDILDSIDSQLQHVNFC